MSQSPSLCDGLFYDSSWIAIEDVRSKTPLFIRGFDTAENCDAKLYRRFNRTSQFSAVDILIAFVCL